MHCVYPVIVVVFREKCFHDIRSTTSLSLSVRFTVVLFSLSLSLSDLVSGLLTYFYIYPRILWTHLIVVQAVFSPCFRRLCNPLYQSSTIVTLISNFKVLPYTPFNLPFQTRLIQAENTRFFQVGVGLPPPYSRITDRGLTRSLRCH